VSNKQQIATCEGSLQTTNIQSKLAVNYSLPSILLNDSNQSTPSNQMVKYRKRNTEKQNICTSLIMNESEISESHNQKLMNQTLLQVNLKYIHSYIFSPNHISCQIKCHFRNVFFIYKMQNQIIY